VTAGETSHTRRCSGTSLGELELVGGTLRKPRSTRSSPSRKALLRFQRIVERKPRSESNPQAGSKPGEQTFVTGAAGQLANAVRPPMTKLSALDRPTGGNPFDCDTVARLPSRNVAPRETGLTHFRLVTLPSTIVKGV